MPQPEEDTDCPWKGSILDYTSTFSHEDFGKDLEEIFPLNSDFRKKSK
ncbi:hypothetical protein [Candidatus Nitrosocosmicus hydrocola]|nr:hypothetical protein [Candidatus Nitrosocosmicus hydrocola]